jgi:hypothetical protein
MSTTHPATTETTEIPRLWEYCLQDGRGHAIAQIVPFIGDHTEIVFYDADGNPADGKVESWTANGAARWLLANGYEPA